MTNTPENTPKKKATPRKRKAAERDADNDDDDAPTTPASKKRRVAKEAPVKDEEMPDAADNGRLCCLVFSSPGLQSVSGFY